MNPLLNAEDEGAQAMMKKIPGVEARGPFLRYGWGRSWDWGAFDLVPRATGGISCSVCRKGKVLGPLELSVSGEHNVLNALAALAAADVLGVPFEKAAATLKDFHGAARRLQTKGTLGGVTDKINFRWIALGNGATAARLTLDQVIEVRIPVPQPFFGLKVVRSGFLAFAVF